MLYKLCNLKKKFLLIFLIFEILVISVFEVVLYLIYFFGYFDDFFVVVFYGLFGNGQGVFNFGFYFILEFDYYIYSFIVGDDLNVGKQL